jgi:hypothetical protein
MMRALMLLCLSLLLMGCGNPVIKTEVIKQYPPEVLLKACTQPRFTGTTYGDAVLYIPELTAVIDQCNQDKQALRSWTEQP